MPSQSGRRASFFSRLRPQHRLQSVVDRRPEAGQRVPALGRREAGGTAELLVVAVGHVKPDVRGRLVEHRVDEADGGLALAEQPVLETSIRHNIGLQAPDQHSIRMATK